MRFEMKDMKCPHCGKKLKALDVVKLVESGFTERPFAVCYDEERPRRDTLAEARVDAVEILKKTGGDEYGDVYVVWQHGDRCGVVREEDGKYVYSDYFTDAEFIFDPGTGELIMRYDKLFF